MRTSFRLAASRDHRRRQSGCQFCQGAVLDLVSNVTHRPLDTRLMLLVSPADMVNWALVASPR